MYKQEHKAGMREYLVSVVGVILLWILCDVLDYLIPIPLVEDILFIGIAGVLVYLVYTHYCAVFSYELGDKKLIITRKIGKREIVEEISYKKINVIYTNKPEIKLPKNITMLTVSVFNKKNYCYVLYNKKAKCLVFEPDGELLRLLKENING